MRKTYTSGFGYYDKSLLEDPKEIPLRPVAPNEFNQVDPENMVPSERAANRNLGEIQGKDPGGFEGPLSNNRESASVRLNPNNDSVSIALSGDLNESSSGSGDTQTRSSRQPVQQVPRDDLYPCDRIGPCLHPEAYTSGDNRTQEEIERDLWHPSDRSRFGLFK